MKEDFFKYPSVDEISTFIPAISEYLDVFNLPALFEQLQIDTLPVINVEGQIIGIVSEYDLAKVLPATLPDVTSYRHKIKVADIMTREVWSERENTSIETLFSALNEMHTRFIPIVEDNNIYTGRCIKRSSLIDFLAGLVKPLSIGGLATPLGVYLTDGKHQAGVGNFALTLTGMVFALLITFIELITGFLNLFFKLNTGFLFIMNLAFFLLILRILPIVKLHAAEHKTINAIEKGLPLSAKTVSMQSRVHTRCGTNIMVLIIGIQILIILSYELSIFQNVILHFAFLIGGFSFLFSKWKDIGAFVQRVFTTAEPEEKYLASGIKAGEELLDLHRHDSDPHKPSIWLKIWNSGFLQVISGFIIMVFLLQEILLFVQ